MAYITKDGTSIFYINQFYLIFSPFVLKVITNSNSNVFFYVIADKTGELIQMCAGTKGAEKVFFRYKLDSAWNEFEVILDYKFHKFGITQIIQVHCNSIYMIPSSFFIYIAAMMHLIVWYLNLTNDKR